MPTDSDALKAKAQTLAKKFTVNKEFKASDGWQQIFRTQNGLVFKNP